MPSEPIADERIVSALRSLRAPIEAYRSAVAAAEEEIRGILADSGTDDGAGGLGAFAAGRIDFSRFAGAVTRAHTLDAATTARLRAAHETMREISARTTERTVVVRVPQGGSLRDAVGHALAEAGRAFGAAHVAAAARRHEPQGSDGAFLRAYPFASWNARERQLAPPLVVDVDGGDLRAGDLAEFLDGCVKIALVVRGDCAPAALVRLITPGAFVAQFATADGFDRLANCTGAGVAAVVPERAALFAHDPTAGKTTHERVTVLRTPSETARTAVGGLSTVQQLEEVRQLVALAMRPAAPAAASAAPAAPAAAVMEPVDRLAAWLLAATEGASHG
ncbi:MAG: hypothetical protein K8T90_14130 [Planctomycetes bacterium]|nr:hypothetical protein [Planctomycetota bacterium]